MVHGPSIVPCTLYVDFSQMTLMRTDCTFGCWNKELPPQITFLTEINLQISIKRVSLFELYSMWSISRNYFCTVHSPVTSRDLESVCKVHFFEYWSVSSSSPPRFSHTCGKCVSTCMPVLCADIHRCKSPPSSKAQNFTCVNELHFSFSFYILVTSTFASGKITFWATGRDLFLHTLEVMPKAKVLQFVKDRELKY